MAAHDNLKNMFLCPYVKKQKKVLMSLCQKNKKKFLCPYVKKTKKSSYVLMSKKKVVPLHANIEYNSKIAL
jgi:hypothetical protein